MQLAHLSWALIALSALPSSCGEKSTSPSQAAIAAMSLKRGLLITCGRSDSQFGSVTFEVSCGQEAKADFNLGVKLLHSFEYDEAEKVFAKIIDSNPACAMAYWGVAMANFHPLWTPPSETELTKGLQAILIAQAITGKSAKESAYIEAISAFYDNWEKVDHRSRCIGFQKAMREVHIQYPTDVEASIFYALSLNAAADPADKSFTNQRKAGDLLNSLYPNEPNHPGIIHYLIHTYDYPELAALALPAAKKYASVAPSSAHALHMPSHIFTRLGLWADCIRSNQASVEAAQCYAAEAGIKGHWDEELHGLDYLMYAHLQRGDNVRAKQLWNYVATIDKVEPTNFKVAYAFAAIPSRYLMENRLWGKAAALPISKKNIAWDTFQWQKAILHFTRFMGAIHLHDVKSAKVELGQLHQIHENLLAQKDTYKANQVQIQIGTAQAWLLLAEGHPRAALLAMNAAADLEDLTEKHPVTPGEVIPARELAGDMLLHLNEPRQALVAYEANLKKHPNRFNGLYGAGLAAEKSGDLEKAALYYRQLLMVVNLTHSDRPELRAVKRFLKLETGKSA